MIIEGLLSFWNLATARSDNSGKNITTESGSISYNGSCALFSYSSFLVSPTISIAGNPFTLFAQVLFSKFPTGENIADIVTKLDGSAIREFRLGYKPSENRFFFYTANAKGNVLGQVLHSVSPIEGKWYSLLAYSNGEYNFLQVNNDATIGAQSGELTSNAGILRIGGQGLTGGTFSGYIKNVGLWNRELTESEKRILYNGGNGNPFPFISPVLEKTIFCIGDSKTEASTDSPPYAGYFSLMKTHLERVTWKESPARYAIGGMRMERLKQTLPAIINNTREFPDIIILDMGVTDIRNDPPSPLPETFENDYGAVIDMLHARWELAKIFLTLIWKRDDNYVPMQLDKVNEEIIPRLISTRPYCFFGVDERITLKWIDNGLSRTIDGIHPNHLGYAAWANDMSNILFFRNR